MQSLYNEEQRKKITKYNNSKNHTKIIKRHERSQDFCPDLRKLCLQCKLHKIWSVDSQDNH